MARLKAQLALHMKACAVIPELLTDFKEGHIVLQFQGRTEPPASGAASSNQDVFQTENYWFHVPLFQLKPWRPTFLQLQLQLAPDIALPDLHSIAEAPSCPSRGVQQCSLKCELAEGQRVPPFKTVWELCESLDANKAWAVQSWRLSRAPVPAPVFGVLIATMADTPSAIIWNSALARQKVRQQRSRWQEDAEGHPEPVRNRPAPEVDHESEPENAEDLSSVGGSSASEKDVDEALSTLAQVAEEQVEANPVKSSSSSDSSSSTSSSSGSKNKERGSQSLNQSSMGG